MQGPGQSDELSEDRQSGLILLWPKEVQENVNKINCCRSLLAEDRALSPEKSSK